MKKFVIVMISLLVLFVFLMLNYLLWDKENLLEQRNNDKITQDWLRGQNSTLQSTVEELEQNIKELENQNDDRQDQIADLEQQARLALQRENSNIKEIQQKNEALDIYKTFMEEELKTVTVQWFSDISKGKQEDSFNNLSENFTIWGKHYSLEEYIEFILNIQSFDIREQKEGTEEDNFRILTGQDEPYLIKAQVLISATMKNPDNEAFSEVKEGPNTLEISFTYNKDTAKWAIIDIGTL